MTESVLDRKFAGRLTVEHAIHLGLLLVAALLCLYALGERPYHHDEAIHAFYSWKISRDGVGVYKYDPVYHGLVLYYAAAAVMKVLGDGDFTGRLSAVLFGLGTMGLAWPLRRWLGRWGAICFLALLTFSPSWIYFARFVRHDVYLALFVLASVYAAFRYGETRRPLYMYLGGFTLGMAACTKEDTYLLGPWLVLSFVLMLAWGVARGEQRGPRAVQEVKDLARQAWIPFLTALFVFLFVWIVIYSAFGTDARYANLLRDPKLLFKPAFDAIDYWGGQQEKKRIGGPWWYYLPQLALYEPLIFFVGLFCAFQLLAQKRAPDRFARFATAWGLGALFIYGWAQEKVPWLLVPQVLPLALLAGRWFGTRIERREIKKPAVLVPTALVGLLTLHTLVSANYRWDAPRPEEPGAGRNPPVRHAEMLAYVQSTYDIHRVLQRIEQAGQALGSGMGTRLIVSGEATWPLSWYLRTYPVSYPKEVARIDTPLVVVNKDAQIEKAIDEAVQGKYEKVPFQIRGWWQWENPPHPDLGDVLRFLLTRETWSGVGSSDAVLYVHKEPRPGLTIPPISVVHDERLRPKDYDSGGPAAVSAAVSWGSHGSGRGQLDEPRGIALDNTGGIYVVDSKNNRVQKFDTAGNVIGSFGSAGSGNGQFKDPGGIAVGPDGSVYVADTWNHRVQQFDGRGTFMRVWADEFFGPRGVAVAADGTVFVTDTGNKRVKVYTKDGQRLRDWGGEGSQPGQFIEPVGIAVNAAGEVVVADTGNHRLQFFSAEGEFLREWPVSGWRDFYTEPNVTTQGDDVFVTDSSEGRVARYRDGKLIGSWGGPGSSTTFNRPMGIASGGSGVLYVADTMNHRVQRLVVN